MTQKNCVTLTVRLCVTGSVDGSWDKWSECVCNHGLDLPGESGVMYRIPKCRRVCPNMPSCPETIEFKSCNCTSAGKCSVSFKYRKLFAFALVCFTAHCDWLASQTNRDLPSCVFPRLALVTCICFEA